MEFSFEIIWRAFLAAWSDLGTNGLGWSLALGTPLLAASWRAQQSPSGQRWKFVVQEWREELKHAFALAVAAFLLIAIWEGCWKIPYDIWKEAKNVPAPIPRVWPLPRPPQPFVSKTPKSSSARAATVPLPIMLSAIIGSPRNPMIAVTNHSNRVAENVNWGMILYRASDDGIFSFRTQTIGYIKSNSSSGNYDMNLPGNLGVSDGNGPLRAGDDLTGNLFVDCPQCQVQTYIVHFDWEQSGWLYESKIKAGYIMPKNPLSKEARAAFIQELKGNATATNNVVNMVDITPR